MKDIHDIRPPVLIGMDPALIKTVLWAALVFLAGLLIFFLVKKFWKKRGRKLKDLPLLPAPLPPFETAIKELEFLLANHINEHRLFYFYLTAILKKYVGRTFGFHATEMTTQEFLKYINTLGTTTKIISALSGFLKSSDQFKYAGINPDKNRVKEDHALVREMIENIDTTLPPLEAEPQGR
ncbi:MAG: hypothetical protein GY729_02635 [Desulfobacteraceae bacterium]|nr:hypothetical protein [Desulfobacteraceae bacterium]